MAMLFYATNSVGPGNRAVVGPQDSITIGPQASLVCTDGNYAISGTGSGVSQRVNVEGFVLGGGGIGWTTGWYVAVDVGATGAVKADGFALYVSSPVVTLTNNGTISSGYIGVNLVSDDIRVLNYGLIDASGGGLNAIAISIDRLGSIAGNEPLVINHGRISSDQVAYSGALNFGDQLRNYGLISGDVLHNAGDDVLLNRGTINGAVDMGTGNDSLDNRNGTIEGNIDLGTGNDVLDTRDGTILGQVLGGDGVDRFVLGAGADDMLLGGAGLDTVQFAAGAGAVFALDGSFANGGLALGDIYAQIERFVGGASGRDVMRGNDAANQFFGRGDDDRLDGAGGFDILAGGQGRDTLTGGLGNDQFRFVQLADCGDVILDFSNGAGNDDRMAFAGAAFGGLAPGALAAGAFVARADNLAQQADDRFIFRTTDRSLWFDADSNGAGAAILVADLQAGATLTVSDILIL